MNSTFLYTCTEKYIYVELLHSPYMKDQASKYARLEQLKKQKEIYEVEERMQSDAIHEVLVDYHAKYDKRKQLRMIIKEMEHAIRNSNDRPNIEKDEDYWRPYVY